MSRKNKTIRHQPSSNRIICNKRCYRNEKEAQNAAEFQMLENMSLELSIYRCNLCRYWHLTKKNSK